MFLNAVAMNRKPHNALVAALACVAGLIWIDRACAQHKQWPACATSNSILRFHESDEPHTFTQSASRVDPHDRDKDGPHAFWLQGGLGVASADIKYRDWVAWESFFHLNASAHFRRHNRVVAFGFDHQGIEAWGIKSWWGTYGVSHSRSRSESSLSLGVGLTSWYYHTESSRGTIRSAKVPCLLAKAQTMIHAKQVLGVGLVLSGNLNKESPYVAGSIVFALGLWNL